MWELACYDACGGPRTLLWNQFSSYPIAWALGLELKSPHLCSWWLDLVSHSLSPDFSVPVFMFNGPLGALWQVSKCWVLSIFFLSCGVSDSRYRGLPRTPVVISEWWVGAEIVLYNLPHGQSLFWTCSGDRGEEAESTGKSGPISSCSQTSALSSIYMIPE